MRKINRTKQITWALIIIISLAYAYLIATVVVKFIGFLNR